jgi:GT2 family glycosyltransferase
MKLASLILVTFRRPQALRLALSALAPDAAAAPNPWEVIVVTQPDGVDYASLRQDFPWVQWAYHSAPGLGACRNAGAALARSSYLFFLDDDCIPRPSFFSALTAVLDREKPVAFSGCIRLPGISETFVPELASPPVRITLRNYYLFMGSCHGIRAAQFHAMGGYDARFGAGAVFPAAEETELLVRLLRAGHQVVYRPQIEVEHPRGEQQAAGRNHALWMGMGAVYRKHARLLVRPGLGMGRFMLRPVCGALLRVAGILPCRRHPVPQYREILCGIRDGFLHRQIPNPPMVAG